MNFHLEHLQKEISSAIAGLSPEAYAFRTDGKWSIAEILEHLYLTYTGTTKGMERCIAAGKPLARSMTMQDRLRRFVVLTCKHMPEGRQSPKQAAPRGLPAEQVGETFFARMAEMDSVIAQAAQKFGASSPLLDHPILGPLDANNWSLFHRIHGHHHAKQILRRRDAARRQWSRSIS